MEYKDALQEIKIRIFRSMYKNEPNAQEKEINDKIDKALNNKNLSEYVAARTKFRYSDSTLVSGEGGVGKTHIFLQASKEVAKDLGLRFIDDLRESDKPTKNDFVFCFIDSSQAIKSLNSLEKNYAKEIVNALLRAQQNGTA